MDLLIAIDDLIDLTLHLSRLQSKYSSKFDASALAPENGQFFPQ